MDSGDLGDLPLSSSMHTLSLSSPPPVRRSTFPAPTSPPPPSNATFASKTAASNELPKRRRRASSVVIKSPRKASGRPRTASLKRSVPFPIGEVESRVKEGWERWAKCWAVVNFDVDKGPDVDNLYPYTSFSKGELSNIAFSSFPDSVGSELEKGLIFSWRIPREDQTEDGESYWYGYCYFYQERDSSEMRGFIQRSIVLVSQHSFPSLFSYCVSLLGPLLQTHGPAMLEAATSSISRWPAPIPGMNEEVAFLSSVITISIPSESQPSLHLPSASVSTSSKLLIATLPFSPFTPLFTRTLHLTFSRLLLLWELVLLNEPILVYANNPRTCGNVVMHLRSLVRPLEAAGDWRPYLHLHATDFSSVCTPQPRTGVIVGITNPLILSSCKRWPHILDCSPPTSPDDADDSKGGLTSKRTRVVKKDEKIEKAWKLAVATGDYEHADAIIARHFQDLTLKFLSPLNRYFQTLLPSATQSNNFRPAPFSSSALLAQLKKSTSPLQFRTQKSVSKIGVAGLSGFGTLGGTAGVEKTFYESFLKTAGFGHWLRMQEEGVTKRAKGKGKER
ncbi:DUF1630-domain-containing protein [Atractiella rhizophila]|nr:DUF1630-domain-containing protein [Atractiella rhizophila]